MNYYELIYLKKELKNKFLGCEIELANTPFKNLLEFFLVGEAENYRLVFSSAPGNIALFADTYRPSKKSNTINFFESVYGQKITDTEVAETDRWFSLVLENGQKIRFRLFSNQANAFLTEDDEILEAFKDYDEEGDEAPEPKELDLFDADISRKSTKNKLTALNLMLPRQNLQKLIEQHNLDEASDDKIRDFVKKMIREMEENPSFRLLEDGDTTLLSEEMLSIPTKKKYDEVNDLIAHRFKTYSHNQRLRQKKGELKKNLERKVKRLNSTLQNLENADKGLDRAEKYEKYGHLLMANAHREAKDEESIIVDDLYEEGREVEIPLKTDMDIAGNAQRYYEKSKNAERSYEQAVKRIPSTKKQKQKYAQLLEELKDIHELYKLRDWEKENSGALDEIMASSGGGSPDQASPFYNLEVQGYPVWIGKNAKSNDKMIQMAHKEDVWMHARGVPGSHLVIRMGNEKDMPPKQVILEAASYAAYNSKARGSRLVPVIVTKKKYVRKPKGAAAGAVLVDREEVEMVSPKKPE